MTDQPTQDAIVSQRAKPFARLKYYPDYIDDAEGLERLRQDVRSSSGHDMARINYNSLGRLIDTIERLRHERAEIEAATIERCAKDMAQLKAENERLSKHIASGVLPGLLDDDEKDALLDFVKHLRNLKGQTPGDRAP